MSFKDIPNIKLSYYSLADNIADEFYIPCLEQAIIYKRAVGYFSSSVLLQISKGLGAFADNGGKMQLLVSTRLDKEDYDAIEKGYDIRKLLNKKIIDNFDFDVKFTQKDDRFKLLSYMIATNLLEIQICALQDDNDSSMFHDKVGYMEDSLGNIITFSGSNNETANALKNNYESFDVFCSWKSFESEQRCSIKELHFNRAWNGSEKGLITIPFPEVIKNKLLQYSYTDVDNFAEIDIKFKELHELNKIKKLENPYIPETIELFKYQEDAIKKWLLNNARGIFDMATGTGKTFAAAGAICRLFSEKERLVVIICAPYKHLVDQWCEELIKFNIASIKCYGGLDYEDTLKRGLIKFKQKRTDFVCAVICNSSFQKENIQNLIKLNLKDTLIVADEAHNFGAYEISKTMEANYGYRLALSATLDRYGDEIGTKKLYDFFGQKCIEYPLERAIHDKYLTPYYYYPILAPLNNEEYDKYITLSKKIAVAKDKNGDLTEYGKRLCLKRARLIAGTESKINMFREKIKSYQGEKNLLVYCGAVKYGEKGYDEAIEEKRQIEIILNILNNDLHIYSSKFTSDEDIKTRKNIINAFKEEDIDALVAIKCLDEGMNIPAIKTAFILASSTNPKEYIQRRGRVLRKAQNKKFAEIYDFITVPYDLDINSVDFSQNLGIEKNLVRKELNRVIDFANLSKNPSYSTDLIFKLKNQYNMDIIMEDEDIYE